MESKESVRKYFTGWLICIKSTILRASSYEPGNRAGPVTGMNIVVCSYGKFQPGYRDEKASKMARNNSKTLGTSFGAKFKKVNKDGGTSNSYIVRANRSVVYARSFAATTQWSPAALENTAKEAD